LNLACVTHAYPRWDGDVAGAFIERLVVALASRGHGVHVVAPADGGRGGKELRHRVPVTRVRYAPARWETLAYRGTMAAAVRSPRGVLAAASLILRQRSAVARLCRDGTIDLVHAHWWVPSGVSAWLAPRTYVVTLHGTDVALLARSRAARTVAGRVLRGAAAVTAVSTYLAGLAARAAGLKPDRIVVQPMPVDTQAFTRTSNGGDGVVTVGRLSKQKRIDLLLDAMAELKRRGRALPLTIVGDGEERPVLERRAVELGIAAQTRFIGAVPPERIPDAVGDADVFAFPAVGEGLGLAAAEALMLGVPVVAALDGGGVTDIVPASGAGRLVSPGDSWSLAQAIDELARDPDSRRLAAEAGAQLRRRLEPAAVAERFEAVYHEALERQRSGDA
jgi:glycosyltransferase involved in cell wall biosynthesis